LRIFSGFKFTTEKAPKSLQKLTGREDGFLLSALKNGHYYFGEI
jgi:hypothetical protein